MSSLPAALAMMIPGVARRPGARSEAATTAARGLAAIAALALAVPEAPAVREVLAAWVGAGHSAMTGGLTRGRTVPNGWPEAVRIGMASGAARC
ncbi:MAG TPA: hypothetical protein VES02_15755 [Dermatophilaceae bacterium]|nr:hypothetical protein [Dermatophilaceae bacterium]